MLILKTGLRVRDLNAQSRGKINPRSIILCYVCLWRHGRRYQARFCKYTSLLQSFSVNFDTVNIFK